MGNRLTIGYWIERANGTREYYLGWTPDDIRHLEKRYYENDRFVLLEKTYQIEDFSLRWEYNEEATTLREYNDEFVEILELGTKNAIALHLWEMATEYDEDYTHAIYLIAVDIFGDYQTWRDAALIATLRAFEKDERFVMEFM